MNILLLFIESIIVQCKCFTKHKNMLYTCRCEEGYTGTRCQFKSIPHDILFEIGPEKGE